MSEQTPGTSNHQPASGGFAMGKSRGLDGFVALHVRSGANRIGNVFPVDIRLEVDEWRLRVDRRPGLLQRVTEQVLGMPPEPATVELRVRLRHCYVRYQCDGVSIPADSKYRSAVEVGAYSERQATSDRTATSGKREGRLDLAVTLAPRTGARAGASYRVGSSWQGSASVERTITASQDLYEVEAVPGGWRIGDRSHGDPLKRDGCLDGQYFARAVEGRPHSCMVEFLPECPTGTIDFAVTTRDGLFVESLYGETIARSDRDLATAGMRDRLAAICIEQAGIDSAADELTFFTVQATCAMAADPADPEERV